MTSNYNYLGIFVLVALFFAVAPIVLAWLLSPKKSNPRKKETYESGVMPFGDPWIRFKPQYYLFALAFVLFGVEGALLFPWALAYQRLELYAVVEALIFLLLLAGGLVYIWVKGWLEWQ